MAQLTHTNTQHLRMLGFFVAKIAVALRRQLNDSQLLEVNKLLILYWISNHPAVSAKILVHLDPAIFAL